MPADAHDPNALPDPPPHRSGQTTPDREDVTVRKEPHERDESSSSQASEPRGVMRQAAKDVERGLTDTSRAEATDQTYERNLRSEPQTADPRGKKKNEPG